MKTNKKAKIHRNPFASNEEICKSIDALLDDESICVYLVDEAKIQSNAEIEFKTKLTPRELMHARNNLHKDERTSLAIHELQTAISRFALEQRDPAFRYSAQCSAEPIDEDAW
jgi:6-phosphogluconolactonase (cycloisomerase 2 family)